MYTSATLNLPTLRMSAHRSLAAGLLLVVIAGMPATASAQGPTFKGGQVSWKASGELTIEFTIQSAWRRDAYSTANGRCINPLTMASVACSGADAFPETGDVILEAEANTTFDPGDGSAAIGSPAGPLLYLVTSVDLSNNLLHGFALDPASLPSIDLRVTHGYAEAAVYRAALRSASRMATVEGASAHVNNGDKAFRVETLVNVGDAAMASPLGSVPPVVLCGIDEVCSVPVEGFDRTGDGLHFRMSGHFEAGFPDTFVQPGPPQAPNSAAIDSVTGVLTWDTTGATVIAGSRSFYSTQVTIESLTPAITGTIPPPVVGPVVITDTIASKLALDFLIELVAASGTPPEFDPGPIGTAMTVQVNDKVNLHITASDVDDGQTLSMNAYGVPPGAKLKIHDGRRSGKASAQMQWRPAANQIGDHVITFVVNDSGGRQRFGTVVITVVPGSS